MLGGVLKWLCRRGHAAPETPTPAPPSPPEDRRWLSDGLQLQRLKRFREAGDLARSALAREPDDVDALQLLSAALLALGDAKESLSCLQRVAELAPGSAEAHVNLASVLVSTGDHAGAIEAYWSAVRLRPAHMETWSSLALLLKTLGRYDEAEECCRSGLHADARHAGLRQVLSGTLFEQGRVEEAIAEARASLDANPAAPAVHSDLLRMLNYSGGQDPTAVYREHLHWDERHGRALTTSAPPYHNDPDPHRRLRVGFVSPHFREHAMTSFFESMVEHHDPKELEIILYADVARPDDCSLRLQAYGAAWRTILGSSDARVADTVRNDAVDILVDLSGHTAHHRLLAFARRPAPVQVTWNGYPNTTGMAAMDYRITDADCDPPGATEHLHTEMLVRLPSIYMSWRPPRGAPEPGPLPALRSGEITFGSFNSCFKITPAIAELWSRILRRVPRSRLMLLTVTGAAAERRVRDLFSSHDIDPARLEILPRMSHEEFLSAHQRADIALDTFPYHGTTTTCYSLWMGLPVVVREGATHVSRVGVSMLTAVGVSRLVARSDDEYVEIAVGLAADLPALARQRADLRDRMLQSPLTDGHGCARALEAAFREMWTAWCRRQEFTNR